MNLSALGQRLTGESGTRSLMDDLGAIAAAGGDIMNLGGGNPSLIPAAEMVFRVRMQALMQHDGAFERAIGTYDAPEGDRGFARVLAALLRREQGWDVSERNIALTNGSQSAFIALFNLFAGPRAGVERGERPSPRILLPLSPEYIGYADAGLSPGMLTACRSTITDLGDGLFKYGVDFEGVEAVEDVAAICVSRPTNPTGKRGDGRRVGPARGESPAPAASRSTWTTPTGFPSPASSSARRPPPGTRTRSFA